MVTKVVSSSRRNTTKPRIPSTSKRFMIVSSCVVTKTVALLESTRSTGATSMTER
ncbi:MAG: hypothetical protein A4E67_01228 [Syntrophaceae bacterium PtaB.Bin038]|nr:MAG: hypothetical protein A4E67_01228 [Syntrophaceae bacterium PtaB.Bin038]